MQRASMTSRVATGIYGLDEVLYGGVPQGNMVLLEGMPGTGKSTMALEFLVKGAVEQDEPGLFITFETRPNQLVSSALNLGWDIQALTDKKMLRIVYLPPQEFKDSIEHSENILKLNIQEMGAKRVVIDGLVPLKFLQGEKETMQFRLALQKIKDLFSETEVTAVLTTETSNTQPIGEAGSGQEQFVADTIISLRTQARRRSVHRSVEITKSRGQDFIGGRHSFKIVEGKGCQVFPRVYARQTQAINQVSSNVRVDVGVPVLDDMLGGGVYEGSISLVVGISGTGKTVLGTQFLTHGGRSGEPGLLVTLDEHPEQIRRNAAELGVPVQELEDKECLFLFYDSPLELDIDEHFYRIRKMVEDHNIKRVVIDSLAAFESAQPDEAYEFIFALSAYFKMKKITAFFSYECPELLGVSQISAKLKASAIVDNIILLNYVEISTLIRRAITVPKARGSGPDQRTREYVIQRGGIVILEDKSVDDVPAVPQLPFSSYYGILARSPTRKSPVIDEHLASGRDLPKSVMPKPGAKEKVKIKAPRKTTGKK